jgi:hypothetical protein
MSLITPYDYHNVALKLLNIFEQNNFECFAVFLYEFQNMFIGRLINTKISTDPKKYLLHEAIKICDIKIIKMLLQYPDINIFVKSNGSAIWDTCMDRTDINTQLIVLNLLIRYARKNPATDKSATTNFINCCNGAKTLIIAKQ